MQGSAVSVLRNATFNGSDVLKTLLRSSLLGAMHGTAFSFDTEIFFRKFWCHFLLLPLSLCVVVVELLLLNF